MYQVMNRGILKSEIFRATLIAGLTIGLFLYLVPLIGQTSQDIRELLPGEEELPRWKMKDSIEVFPSDNLFDFINGGADIFLEYGFVEALKCNYINAAQKLIRCEIYMMTDDSAAFGIFSVNTTLQGKPVAVGNLAYQYDQYIEMWQGKYFVRCISEDNDSLFINALLLLADQICNKIVDKGKKPVLIDTFKFISPGVENIKYFRGQIALTNIYNFGLSSLAGFTEGIAASLDENVMFVFAYKDEYKCREWFASAKGKMQMNQKYSGFTPVENGFMIQSKTGEFLSFKPCKRFILIIKGMTWEEANPLMFQLEQNLNRN